MKFLEFYGDEVRGTALDVDHLLRLGNAFGGRHKKVLLGRWNDEASAMARSRALTAGMLAVGASVADGGSLPQPILGFLARECGIGAVCAVLPESVRFRGDGSGWIADFRGGKTYCAGGAETVEPVMKPMSPYLRKLAQVMDMDAVKKAGFRIRLDAEGAAWEFAVKLLEKLQCTVADEGECDAVFSLSPDGTRLLIGDYGPEMTIRMMVEHILEAYPCDTVLAGSDRTAEEVIRSCGCECFTCEAEEMALLNAMHMHNAVLGGVIPSGMLCWRKFQPGPDGFLVMALVLEMLALSGQTLPEIAGSLR